MVKETGIGTEQYQGTVTLSGSLRYDALRGADI